MEKPNIKMKDDYQELLEGLKDAKKKKVKKIVIEACIEVLENRVSSLMNYVTDAFINFLKFDYQPEKMSSSWLGSAKNAQFKINLTKKRMPSLFGEDGIKPEDLQLAYLNAIDVAAQETELDYETFPKDCLYTIDQILNSQHRIFDWKKPLS